MVYKWEGYSYSVPAQTVGETCEQIESRDGEVTRESLVNEARDKKSPIHDLFEWNDGIAAEKWRQHQAGVVLSALKVEIINNKKEPSTIKAFMSVKENPQKASYMNINVIQNSPDYMKIVLRNALYELATFKKKYEGISALEPVMKVIEQVSA